MNRKQLQGWIEMLGILAVIGSLIFVGFQVKQDQNIARATLGAATFDNFAETYQTMIDPNFSVIYAKMLKSPDTLTDAEMLSINAFYLKVTSQFARSCYLVERGIFSDCEEEIREVAPIFFSNIYAQKWWKSIGPSNHTASLPSWIDSFISTLDINTEINHLNDIREAMK